nr:hypothetical protein [Tanacetum cinerariifolium]
MTTPTVTSSTDSQMHNNIMAAGSRDHPSMLQQDDIHSGDHTIHLILTGIGDEIYSTVDACQTAQEMWEAIESKEIAKPITPPSESTSEEDSNPEQAQRDMDMQKNLALIAKYFKRIYKPTNNNLRTSSNSRNKNVDTTLRKPKRVKDFAYHKEKTLLCKQAEKGVPLQAEQFDWLADMDEEIIKQELEAHYNYMAKIQNDQNDVESDDERVALANLIETSKALEESNSVWDSCLVALQNKQTEFEKYKAFNDRIIDYEKLKQKQLKFLNKIVYKRNESIQTIHMMEPKVPTYNGRPTFSNLRYLKQAQSEIPCLYAFLYDQSTHANRLIPDGEETLALKRESRSKLNKDSVRHYDYTTLNSLYEIFKPPRQEFEIQLAHANEIRKTAWRKSFMKYKPNIFKNIGFLPVSKSISKSQQAYNVMINNINHFKEIVDNDWVKHTKDQFRAPTAKDMDILIKTCLMPLALKTQNDSFIFVHELKQEMHTDLKYVESLEKEIDELESDKAEFSNMYDMILQECVSNEVMCTYLLSLSDLDALAKLQCLYLPKVKECVCLAQSFRNKLNLLVKKFTLSFYKVDSNHFACVTKMLNDVNARTKKPNVVPISTRKCKGHANKSVATPHKKKVASKSTT